MKTILKLGLFALASLSLLAGADEIDMLQGQYTLQAATQGTCFPQITVRSEAFSTRPGVGIYGSEPGQIVFQMVGVNQGQIKIAQVNPMTSQIQGYAVSMSVVNLGKISASTYMTDATGNMTSSSIITGSFDQNTLSFTLRSTDEKMAPASNVSSCSYTKNH